MAGGYQQRDVERVKFVTAALEQSNVDALVCALPTNVLLISGYWPVIGTSIAVITRAGFIHVLAPDDEEELARESWADVVETFSPGSLHEIKTAIDVLRAPLARIVQEPARRHRIIVGYESGPGMEPASYVGMHLFGTAIYELLREMLSPDAIRSADDLLRQLRSVLSSAEQAHVRGACDIAANAFSHGSASLRPSLKETEAAALFRASLDSPKELAGGARTGGSVFCMSGPNSAEAYAAYQRSRAREIQSGDLVLIHCNSYLNGYWTDITRTFCVRPIDPRTRRMFEAIFTARAAAIAAIRPGVRAADVDRAARAVLSDHGFAKEFKHGLGHGVGFAAIDHNAIPRLHPASSEDVLQPGMIFNIEPAIYFDGCGGIRHCDMVLLTDDGPEVLTPFQSTLESLTLG